MNKFKTLYSIGNGYFFFPELILTGTKDMHLIGLTKVSKSDLEPREHLYLRSISFRNKQSDQV